MKRSRLLTCSSLVSLVGMVACGGSVGEPTAEEQEAVEVSVEPGQVQANDKAPFVVGIKWQPTEVKYEKESGSSTAGK